MRAAESKIRASNSSGLYSFFLLLLLLLLLLLNFALHYTPQTKTKEEEQNIAPDSNSSVDNRSELDTIIFQNIDRSL